MNKLILLRATVLINQLLINTCAVKLTKDLKIEITEEVIATVYCKEKFR